MAKRTKESESLVAGTAVLESLEIETEKKEWPFPVMIGEVVHYLMDKGGVLKDHAAIVVRIWGNSTPDKVVAGLQILHPARIPASYQSHVVYDKTGSTVQTFHKWNDPHEHTFG